MLTHNLGYVVHLHATWQINSISRPQTTTSNTFDNQKLLPQALEYIVETYPPGSNKQIVSKGLWSGLTGIGYLFFHVSKQKPQLVIASKLAIDWAKAYLNIDIADIPFEPSIRCGISSEVLTYQAVSAVVLEDLSVVDAFVKNLSLILETKTETEWHSGRSGALYLTRLIMHWLPNTKTLLVKPQATLRESIIRDGPDWKFHGTRYIGAAHGDIETITQLALSSPSEMERQKLQDWLMRLLDWQRPNGNWAVNESQDPRPYVQFCHGAPGVVNSLLAIKGIFPDLRDGIDDAVRKANELIVNEGLLKKEPNLCHGIWGNALCLPLESRNGFLINGIPEMIDHQRSVHPAVFEKSNIAADCSLLTGYWPSLAWTCLVAEHTEPGIIGYTDV